MQTPPRRVMRVRDVVAELGLSRTTVYNMVAKGEFPEPIRLGSRAIAWRVAEVDAWLASRDRADSGRAVESDSSTTADSTSLREHVLLLLERKARATDAYCSTLESLEADLKARRDALSSDLAEVNHVLDSIRRDLKRLRNRD